MSESQNPRLPRHIEQTVDAALRTSAETLKKLSSTEKEPDQFPKSTGEMPAVKNPEDDFDEAPTKDFDLNQILTRKTKN